MRAVSATAAPSFVHRLLESGVEFAADVLPERNTVALVFRWLSGLADVPADLTGISAIVERTLSKGTERYADGRAVADAFDALGAHWMSGSGRQSSLIRVACLPEFVLPVVDLVAEVLCHPTFPAEACRVAVELAQQDLRHLEDDPQGLVRRMIQRLTLGPVLGRHVAGEEKTLPNITPERVRRHWEQTCHSGRLQVAVAGAVDADAVAQRIDVRFTGLGSAKHAGREPLNLEFAPARQHRAKDLQQAQIAITLPGLPRDHAYFAVEEILIDGILSGGMSSRLFTEVREKQGLVYWVGAWHEQLRGAGVIHLGASSTPERADQTYRTLLRELQRLAEDVTEEETNRARNAKIAHAETEEDLTGARATSLSEDLFFFSRPVGLGPRRAAYQAVTVEQVREYAGGLALERLNVATLGPRPLEIAV